MLKALTRLDGEEPSTRHGQGTDISLALVMPQLLAEWLSCGRNPRVICDVQQKVLWHCPNFGSWLDKASSVKMERHVITLTD